MGRWLRVLNVVMESKNGAGACRHAPFRTSRPKHPHGHEQQIDCALEAVRNLRCKLADTGRGFSELHSLGGSLLRRLIAEELRVCHAVSVLFPRPGDVESPPTHDLQIVPPARPKFRNSQSRSQNSRHMMCLPMYEFENSCVT